MASLPKPAIDVSSLEQSLQALQERIDQLHANLAQQQKLATLGMITAVIAHEFNNILTPMISYTRYALTEKADEALREKALQKALAGAERAAMISNSLLGFATSDDSTTANVKKTVQDTLTCLSREPGKDGITLTLEIDEALHAAINPGQLQQVLMNLIVNARAAMLSRSGGVRRLSIFARKINKGRTVEIAVRDTGPGIDAAVLPRIFDPFFSTKPKAAVPVAAGEGAEANHLEEIVPKGGTGLGLTICRDLIVAANGNMRVESVVSEGARFIIELPVAEG